MKFNTSKSVTIIFPRIKLTVVQIIIFPLSQSMIRIMCFVDKCKYLGHFLSTLEDDNADIMNQRCLLYTRTNLLIRKFAKCNIEIAITYLFRTYCINFLWNILVAKI